MQWKVTDLHVENGKVVSAKYHVLHRDGDQSVESEGYWHFKEFGDIAFESLTEEIVVDWIKKASMQDGVSTIESALEKQITPVQKVAPPWLPPTFTVKL